MSLYDYRVAVDLMGAPFEALVMAAVLRADSDNLDLLAASFPQILGETRARYDAPGGVLSEDET